MLRKLRWKAKFYFKKYFVNDGVERRKDPNDISDVELAPPYKVYFNTLPKGVYLEEELPERYVQRHN